ncbi:unnamed protein product [Closterium sp. NIES-53]
MSIHAGVAHCSRVGESQRLALVSYGASHTPARGSATIACQSYRVEVLGSARARCGRMSSSSKNVAGSGSGGVNHSADATWPGSQYPPATRFSSSSAVLSVPRGISGADSLPILGRRGCLEHRLQLHRPAPSSLQITSRFSSGSGIRKNPSPGSKPGKRPSSSTSSPTPSSSSPQQAKAALPLASFPWAPLLSSILARFHSLLSVSFSLLLLPYLLSSSLGELAFALRQQQVLLAGAAALAACLGCYWLMERVGKELGGLVKEGGAVGKVLPVVVQNSTNLMMVVAVICGLLKAAGPSLPPVLRVIIPFLANGALVAVFAQLVLRLL